MWKLLGYESSTSSLYQRVYRACTCRCPPAVRTVRFVCQDRNHLNCLKDINQINKIFSIGRSSVQIYAGIRADVCVHALVWAFVYSFVRVLVIEKVYIISVINNIISLMIYLPFLFEYNLCNTMIYYTHMIRSHREEYH